MTVTNSWSLTRVWEQVSAGENTVLLELGRAGGEIEYFIGSDGELGEGNSDSQSCHRLNSDRPVASLYGMADQSLVVWARQPSTIVEMAELIVTAY